MLLDSLMTKAVYEERLREAELERRARRYGRSQAGWAQRGLTRLQAYTAHALIALGRRLQPKSELAYAKGVR